MNRSIRLVICLCTFLFLGCSQKIDGLALMNSDDSKSKRGLVDVQVVPEAAFVAHIKQQIPSLDAHISSRLESAQKMLAGLEAMQRSSEEMRGAAMAVETFVTAVPTNYALSNAADAASNASKVAAESLENIHRINSEVKAARSGANGKLLYSSVILGSIGRASTKDNGVFEIVFEPKIETNTRVAVVASKDGDYWFLWIKPEKGTTKVVLSDLNQAGKNCPECIFKGDVTPHTIKVVN